MKASASDVYFDLEAVRQKTASKSSLMDLNGVFVFRDEFIEQEQSFDVQVPDSQPISETLKILQDNMCIFAQADAIDPDSDRKRNRGLQCGNIYVQERIGRGIRVLFRGRAKGDIRGNR